MPSMGGQAAGLALRSGKATLAGKAESSSRGKDSVTSINGSGCQDNSNSFKIISCNSFKMQSKF